MFQWLSTLDIIGEFSPPFPAPGVRVGITLRHYSKCPPSRNDRAKSDISFLICISPATNATLADSAGCM
jgi:hypothetical protein